MFKKLFKEVGRFFHRLFKDPLRLVIVVVGAVLTVLSFGAAAPAYAAALGMSTVVMQVTVGALLACVGIGFEQDWLLMALSIIGAAVSIYQIAFNNFGIVRYAGMFKSTGLLSALNMSQGTLQMLYELGIASRAMLIGLEIAIVAGLQRAIEDDVSVISGVSSVVGEVAGDIVEGGTGIIGDVVDGIGDGLGSIASSLTGSPVFWIAVGAYLLLRSRGSSTTRITLEGGNSFGKNSENDALPA